MLQQTCYSRHATADTPPGRHKRLPRHRADTLQQPLLGGSPSGSPSWVGVESARRFSRSLAVARCRCSLPPSMSLLTPPRSAGRATLYTPQQDLPRCSHLSRTCHAVHTSAGLATLFTPQQDLPRFAFSRAHMAVALLRSVTKPSAAQMSIVSFVGLYWRRTPSSEAA